MRNIPAGCIQLMSRAKRAPVEQCGDLTPVRPGGLGYHWMRCSHGHEALYMGTSLRGSLKEGKPLKCRDCVASGAVPKRGSR